MTARAGCIAALVALVWTTGCIDRPVVLVPIDQTEEVKTDYLLSGVRKLDLLFVIDNSLSMAGEQQSLANNFPLMAQRLSEITGGQPSLHLAVVSTDLGVGSHPADTDCSVSGDEGVFNSSAPDGESCATPDGAFIADLNDGVSRKRNYTGDLGDAFSCIARLGSAGCGFEQSLEAMRRALNGSNDENAGFLRNDAVLAVVILSDEDDCSASDTTMFDPRPRMNTGGTSLSARRASRTASSSAGVATLAYQAAGPPNL